MGKIKKILENELVGGAQTTDIYPVTSVKAVYDGNNERLDHILARRGMVNVSTNYNDDHIAEVLTLSQAIAKVPSSDRVLGFTMTFLSSDGWKTYQFTGNSISNWSDTTKWDPVLHSSEVLQELGNSKTAPVSQKVVSDAVTHTRQMIEDIFSNGLIPAGISTKRFENFKEFNIYGYGSSVSILKDSSGNYDTPPIEIAGGGISNITVIEDGGITDHPAYCVHSDSNSAKGKTLKVDNCHFISNSGHCWGVGTRNGYTLEFRNCVFEGTDNTGEDLTGICWYSHNTTVDGNIPSLDDKSKVIFIGCTFISDKKYCMRLQDWYGSNTDYCEWTFINCTFICTSDNIDDAVYIEYKNYPDELGVKKFKHKFSLSEKSCGNNVSWLNYNN